MFEILEHTADIGFLARGASLEALFAECARALVSIEVDLDRIDPRDTLPIAASGEDREALLVNWLNEVLYYLDGKHIALCEFHLSAVESERVTARALGEPLDPARHSVKLIVKGVTYHQLRVWEEGGQWNALVFLDI